MNVRSMLLGVATFVLTYNRVGAQTIRGRIVDETTTMPISSVEVTIRSERGIAGRAATDASGLFTIGLPAGGKYSLRASHVGYASLDSVAVDVRTSELVEVVLRMSTAAIPLQALTVRARGSDLRHQATWEGFLVRRERLPPIGNARAVARDDPEMQAAVSVEDVLNWIVPPGRGGCRILVVEGLRRKSGFDEVLRWSVELIEGVEFYKYVTDAPLDYRSQGEGCGVIAIWLRKDIRTSVRAVPR